MTSTDKQVTPMQAKGHCDKGLAHQLLKGENATKKKKATQLQQQAEWALAASPTPSPSFP